ncbi:hypothetical protein KR084_001841 [Drosophila pseudotakahashii]|nr:hypothetical protein KR084_001841 [Drosophila pseudotakahashii]
MPVDQVIISYMRSRNWINVLLLRSMNLFQPVLVESPSEKIEVRVNGFCWSEQNLEYRIVVNDFFEIATKTEDGEVPYSYVEMQGNNLVFGLALKRIKHRVLDQRTVDVEQGDLPLRINPFTPYCLHCSNCANLIIERRQFHRIQEVGMTTVQPQNYFCARNRVPVYPTEEELFFGLNYLVICPDLLGIGDTTTQDRRGIECSRCKQSVGEYLGKDVAVQLYADALRLVSGDSPFGFEEIFGHVTPTQLMIRLLHDAEPISPEKTRLFLKAVRPDGQLQYLHLLVDTKQVHILRSELDTSDLDRKSGGLDALPMEADTSSESDFEMRLSDTSGSSINPPTGDDSMDSLPKPKVAAPQKSVKYVQLRGFRGCRLKYLFSGDDHDLIENEDITSTWHDEGTLVHRISYAMMVDLMSELNANEHLAAALEKMSPPIKSRHPRLSFLIYEADEDFYARQEQITKTVG